MPHWGKVAPLGCCQHSRRHHHHEHAQEQQPDDADFCHKGLNATRDLAGRTLNRCTCPNWHTRFLSHEIIGRKIIADDSNIRARGCLRQQTTKMLLTKLLHGFIR
ncbi:hypothetical protein C7B82_23470 [Stenomitos frigidus ULC18]|uniref:Uncharacterized protein n=1 Tax=Stenomitos frigidus ULC18 TaxID=2107698 RepID=A0A2T1DXS1_9CYAN|nr:hypothetical protein C7B82_23470 [Stenomitos frigidus ULC18]